MPAIVPSDCVILSKAFPSIFAPDINCCNSRHVQCKGARVVELNMININVNAPIPESLASLDALRVLQIENANLVGTIPESLGRLTKLNVLNLNNNYLIGPIPSSIGNLRNLLGIKLSRNDLRKSIPASICSLTSLVTLDLSHNKLEGEIPASIGRMTELQSFNLERNMIRGKLPSSMRYLKNVHTIKLGRNDMHGPVPSWLNSLNLKSFNISQNSFYDLKTQFTGSINTLVSLDLSKNYWLEGQIPSHFKLLHRCIANQTRLCINENEKQRNVCGVSQSCKDFVPRLRLSFFDLIQAGGF